MKLGFEEAQTPYSSGSQSARAWTEQWVRNQVYCPNCGSTKIDAFPNNSPVADFYCSDCREEYELKSQKVAFRDKILDGAFRTKCERLAANNNPSLFLLNYDLKLLSVMNFFVVPKHFFVREIIEERKPRFHLLRVALVGSVLKFCSIKFLRQGRFLSFGPGCKSQRRRSFQNGSKRCFCAIKRQSREVGSLK
jgi:hypothetical protein